MNLWRDHLPEFDGAILEAKYARLSARAFTDAERDAFAVAERIAVRFALAERVLISTPMWNFGIPYKLKQWIDVISQPGLTFRFDSARGYLPLLKDRPTVVILASGGDFVTGMNRGASIWPHLICARHCASSASATYVSCRSGRPRGQPSRSARRARARTAVSPISPRDFDACVAESCCEAAGIGADDCSAIVDATRNARWQRRGFHLPHPWSLLHSM